MPEASHVRGAATATRLIAKHGRAMSLVTINDDAEPWEDVSGTETTQAVTGVQTSFTAQEVDGNLVKADDKKMLIDSTVTPTTAMRLQDGSTDYSIIAVEEVKPGDIAILYKLQVRV